MSESISRELMTLVERVVRPLPIPLARRKRMRGEFLDHLQAIFAEEMDRQGNEEAALASTKARFGNPAELTAELRQAIGWRDIMQETIERFWAQRTDETSFQFICRLMFRTVLLLALLMATVSLSQQLITQEPFTISKWIAIAGVVGFQALWQGCFLWGGIGLGSALTSVKRDWKRALLYSALLTAAWPVSLLLLALACSGTWGEFLPLDRLLAGTGITLVLGTTFGVLHARELRYRQEWASLVCDQ